MPDYNGPYIYATTHDFKSNIAKYLRLLEHGAYEAVFIKRYDKPVAFVMPYERQMKAAKDKNNARENTAEKSNKPLDAQGEVHESE